MDRRGIKNEKGITLVTLIISVIVMLIISSMLIYTGINNAKIERMGKIKIDIKSLSDNVNAYYLKNNAIPIEHESALVKILKQEIIPHIEDRNQEDDEIYYILEVNLLENTTLNVNESDGKFIINNKTHTIYYIERRYN